jgi:hypothetical protein
MASALARRLARVEGVLRRHTAAEHPTLARLRRHPPAVMELAGYLPDDWQQAILRYPSPRTLLNCSRQSGKSTVTAALALRTALLEAPALVLLLSPSLRQSGELLLRVMELYRALGRPVPTARPRDNTLKLELANGSRIISLPGNEETIRCYSAARLLVIDEAARVTDDLYRAVRPMLAVSGGRLVCLSTPFGKRGWFYDAWRGPEEWRRVRITAGQVPRIPGPFLEEERRAIGERWFSQEYGCEFLEILGAYFSGEDIEAILDDTLPAEEFPDE